MRIFDSAFLVNLYTLIFSYTILKADFSVSVIIGIISSYLTQVLKDASLIYFHLIFDQQSNDRNRLIKVKAAFKKSRSTEITRYYIIQFGFNLQLCKVFADNLPTKL